MGNVVIIPQSKAIKNNWTRGSILGLALMVHKMRDRKDGRGMRFDVQWAGSELILKSLNFEMNKIHRLTAVKPVTDDPRLGSIRKAFNDLRDYRYHLLKTR